MDIKGLKAFNLVVGHGGFGRASRLSGQSKATLSRHVRALEESLGVRLIERGSGAFGLSEEGTALYTRTEGALAEIEDAGQAIGAGIARPRGVLRVSTTVSFAHVALGRIVAGFAVAYPEVRLEVVGEDRYVDLVGENYDVVIRMNPRPDAELVGQCFLRDRMVVVAAADVPWPLSPAAAVPAVVLTGTPIAAVWQITREHVSVAVHTDPVLRLSSPLMIRDAVRAGAGVALLPRSMVAEDLETGRLICWGIATERNLEVWALHTSRRLVSPKVGAFVRYLQAAFPTPVAS